jgi:uroporphyrinogen decarboxylase
MKKIFSAFDAKVRFFHNDADGVPCAPLLPEWGVNLYNFGYEHSLTQMRELTGGKVTLLGNIPPRDVLAQGKPADVEKAVFKSIEPLADRSRLILSCGGGLPPFVNTDNLNAFLRAAGHEVEAQACAA